MNDYISGKQRLSEINKRKRELTIKKRVNELMIFIVISFLLSIFFGHQWW